MPWTCDNCGEPVRRVEDGYVEWMMVGRKHPRTGRGLRLVHHQPASPHAPEGSCYHNEEREHRQDAVFYQSMHLSAFLGTDGLMVLLSMLAEGELPKSEVLELIKRLHIPGYEQARFHFDEAIAEGVFEPNTPKGYYWQHDIQAVLDFIAEEG